MAERQFTVIGPDFTCQHLALDPGGLASSFNKKIDAPVGAGTKARNLPKDVLTVKELLNRIPLEAGGPIPLLKMTKKCDHALLVAIKNFQNYRLSDDSGLVTPKGETMQLLNFNPAGMPDLAADAKNHIPRVLEIIGVARAALQLAKFQLNRPSVPGGIPSLNSAGVLAKLNRHFHLDKSPNAADHIDFIDGIFSNMQTAIGYIPHGLKVFRNDPSNYPYFAYSFNGGYELERRFLTLQKGADKGSSAGSIYLCGRLLKMDDEAVTYTIMHELAHYVGPMATGQAIIDFGYAHKPGYDKLTTDKALRTADCYSQFAFEAINRRFVVSQHEKSA